MCNEFNSGLVLGYIWKHIAGTEDRDVKLANLSKQVMQAWSVWRMGNPQIDVA